MQKKIKKFIIMMFATSILRWNVDEKEYRRSSNIWLLLAIPGAVIFYLSLAKFGFEITTRALLIFIVLLLLLYVWAIWPEKKR